MRQVIGIKKILNWSQPHEALEQSSNKRRNKVLFSAALQRADQA